MKFEVAHEHYIEYGSIIKRRAWLSHKFFCRDFANITAFIYTEDLQADDWIIISKRHTKFFIEIYLNALKDPEINPPVAGFS